MCPPRLEAAGRAFRAVPEGSAGTISCARNHDRLPPCRLPSGRACTAVKLTPYFAVTAVDRDHGPDLAAVVTPSGELAAEIVTAGPESIVLRLQGRLHHDILPRDSNKLALWNIRPDG